MRCHASSHRRFDLADQRTRIEFPKHVSRNTLLKHQSLSRCARQMFLPSLRKDKVHVGQNLVRASVRKIGFTFLEMGVRVPSSGRSLPRSWRTGIGNIIGCPHVLHKLSLQVSQEFPEICVCQLRVLKSLLQLGVELIGKIEGGEAHAVSWRRKVRSASRKSAYPEN